MAECPAAWLSGNAVRCLVIKSSRVKFHALACFIYLYVFEVKTSLGSLSKHIVGIEID